MYDRYVIASDDYASIKTPAGELYYGYEVTNDNEDWCFQARDKAGHTVTIDGPTLAAKYGLHERERPEMFLLAGVAALLESGALTWPA